ncbi:MAG: sigma-54-dependent Fis family transcriptional regulator, partial [Firmicutes bacterium]|nr:sigma-54-dependent Fis family transcriptional regulator [Bacillota bacterium]
AIPLYISRITALHKAYGQIDAEGYGILFEEFPIVKKPEDIPLELLLFAFDQSGTLHSAWEKAAEKQNILVVGNNLLTNLLFGWAVRKRLGSKAHIVCLFDKNSEIFMTGPTIDELLQKTFSEIHYVNILKPMECLSRLNMEDFFDMTINCANIPGAETVNILASKAGGTVIFANLINNYNIGLNITEAISRQLEIRCADGFSEPYAGFDIEVLREILPYLEKATLLPSAERKAFPETSLTQPGAIHELTEEFICESRPMKEMLANVLSVAKYDCNVLITGETGVGKEKVASLIQKKSTRKMQPFLRINCAAIPQNLMESEFFGYEKGAFTGADAAGKKGYFEQADNGTIFLDEVGDLPADLQAKLLRVIQEGEFYRVGGSTPIHTNVRILSATNQNLEDLVENRSFRRDLYYRLNVFPIHVPSLQERTQEIPALARFFAEKYSEKFGVERTIAPDAAEHLKSLDWPGNIRQLENMVQRLLIASTGKEITLFDVLRETGSDLNANLPDRKAEDLLKDGEAISLDELVESLERDIIRSACEKYGSTRKAAKAIGISQTQLVRKKNKYGI